MKPTYFANAAGTVVRVPTIHFLNEDPQLAFPVSLQSPINEFVLLQ